MSATDKNCTDIQDLLIKKGFDELTGPENLLLIEHLQRCEPCAAFQDVLSKIQDATPLSEAEDLFPDPAIRQNIRNQIRADKTARRTATVASTVWDSLLAILRLRVPVYQAVLGMAAIFAIFISLAKLNARGDREMLTPSKPAQNGKQMLVAPEVSPHIAQIDSQKIGRSVAEDSLLMKHTVTVM